MAGRRIALRAGIAAALAAAALGGCGEEGPFAPEVENGYFGINGQGLRMLAAEGRLDELDANLGAIADGGVDFVRANIDWTLIEPEPPRGGHHDYDFSDTDAFMRALAEHGLGWQLTAVGIPTPEWAATTGDYATCGFQAAPARADDFAGLAGALAERYGRGGTYWSEHPDAPRRPVTEFEIWNEPNFGTFWCPQPDPAAYGELLVDSARAVHDADPQAQVLMGGLAGFRDTTPAEAAGGESHMSVADFLATVLAAEPAVADEIGAIGIHAYAPDSGGVMETVRYYRDTLEQLGLGDLPMSLNETGWYTSGAGGSPPVSEEDRADYIAQVASEVARSNCGVESIAPHTWITAEADPANQEDWYGIADPATGQPRESGLSYLGQVQLLEGTLDEEPPREEVGLCD